VAFLMALCNHHYTATQFACLSALAAVGRVMIGPIAGIIVLYLGWTGLYAWSFILSFPGILLLLALRNRVRLNAVEVI
jgi:PAT family beta-lactamase induction signal transducer AmpG